MKAGCKNSSNKHTLLLILDSDGAPDVAAYGDEGSDTLRRIYYAHTLGFALPNLECLGLAAWPVGKSFLPRH
jgi:phosphopentomutase